VRPRLRKTLKIGGVVLAIVLVSFVAIGWRVLGRVTALPHPIPAGTHPGAEAELHADPRGIGAGLRVYGLVTSETMVPFGQFYGGLEGWIGAAAIWKGGLHGDESWVPVQVVAIVHPEHGVVLVDTGLGAAQTRPFSYYSVIDGGLNAGIWRDSENRIAAAGDLLTQLAAHDIAPDDVTHVVLTHLHEDHVGELGSFPRAVVHVSALEWDDRDRTSYEPSFAAVTQWDRFAFDSGHFHTFAASKDLLGDGTIVLLPTPGHSMGHTAVLVVLGDHHVLVTGDAAYTLRHLDPDALASFNYFGEQGLATYQDSVRRMAQLVDALPDVIVLPPHDPFAYNVEHMQRALADGRLDVGERAQLDGMRRALFDADGRLRLAARPRWDEAQQRVVSDIP
jgi:glyoxylase-like metal-dependent hydrolase (beta-lactamase superfamily II)